jgi:hypothetical protein
MCTRGRARSTETSAAPNGLGQYLTDITDAGYNRSPITQKTLGSVKSRAAAEAWGAALPLAPPWVLGSVAAWLSAMPLPLRWASALVCPRSPRRKYRPDPNHTHYLVDPQRRIESKRCGQPSYSKHRGSQ